MRDPDETLAAIDDVIHWDGFSDDAMMWTAEEPKRPDFSALASGLAAFTEPLRPVSETLLAMRSAMRGMRPSPDQFAQILVID